MPSLLNHNRAYNKEEDDFIYKNYLSKSDQYIANRLGRTRSGVIQRRNRLYLFKVKKTGFKILIEQCLFEIKKLKSDWHKIQDMKALIIICQLETNQYKRDRYKSELRQLSGIKW